ncbi:hypothetical protein [Lignipirellula cremea]|uniref:Uncharacterized protein n=1 Tax=Lignipirellula cremea TaxID=2528010 RepID=A0A518DLY4_9BACT|nr:hypothetical protein [Lignipirellula cremea]QDU92832.1 hypothetical protein Pla8534_06050 [Lignipirellula cremea]
MIVSLLLVASCLAQPAAPSAEDTAVRLQVRRLIRDLDHRELTERIAAENKLIAMGVSVLPLLPPVTPRSTAEIKERLSRVRKTLENLSAEEAARTSVVTLKGEMSLIEAMQALAQQTGNQAAGYENYDGMVTVDFEETPYWEALDKILDQLQLTLNPYGGDGDKIHVRSRPEEELPRFGQASYNGIYRIEPTRIDAVRDLRNPQISGLKVGVKIEWEPRIEPIVITQPMADLSVVTDTGEQLAAGDNTLSALVQTDIPAVELTLPLQLPPRTASRIAELKGKLHTLVPGRLETFQFSGLENARNVEQQRGGVTVTLERLQANGQLWGARVLVRFDEAANALESHRNWIFGNPAYMLDAAGERVDYAALETVRQGESEVGIEYYFDLEKGPADCTLIYQTPAAIIKREVEYSLKEIQLP